MLLDSVSQEPPLNDDVDIDTKNYTQDGADVKMDSGSQEDMDVNNMADNPRYPRLSGVLIEHSVLRTL